MPHNKRFKGRDENFEAMFAERERELAEFRKRGVPVPTWLTAVPRRQGLLDRVKGFFKRVRPALARLLCWEIVGNLKDIGAQQVEAELRIGLSVEKPGHDDLKKRTRDGELRLQDQHPRFQSCVFGGDSREVWGRLVFHGVSSNSKGLVEKFADIVALGRPCMRLGAPALPGFPRVCGWWFDHQSVRRYLTGQVIGAAFVVSYGFPVGSAVVRDSSHPQRGR